jgi:hypothetical protein
MVFPDMMPVDWDEYANGTTNSDKEIHQQLGYYRDVVDHMWTKYCIFF